MSDERSEQTEREVYRVPERYQLRNKEDGVSLLEAANVLLRYRWRIVSASVVFAALAVVFTLVTGASYTSRTSFMPQTGGEGMGQLSQLAGVASQFGVTMPTGEIGQTPQFYADLVASPRLLKDVVTSTYVIPTETDTLKGDLVEIYETDEDFSPPEALVEAVDRLRENITVSSNPETGLVSVSVTTEWPSLSKEIADRLVEGVNEFNLQVRQSQAAAEAEFVERRLTEAQKELRAAETNLENFLQRNVGWQQSPELRFQHDRLQRRVSLKQQVYRSLATRYEEARINEVRNTPVITQVTPPRRPARPDPERIPLKVILGLLLGGTIGAFWAFGSEYGRTLREEEPEGYREFIALKKDAAGEFRSMSRGIRRLVGDTTSQTDN